MTESAAKMAPSAVLVQADKTVQESKPISWVAFQRKYLTREDQYKYEWVNGTVVKTIRGMDKSQLYIQFNLQNFFDQLKIEKNLEGTLIAEPDLFFFNQSPTP